MFGAPYFSKGYFGGRYFGPNVEVIVVVQPVEGTINSSKVGADGYRTRSHTLPKVDFEKDRMKIIKQLMREDEEIINIIVKSIQTGVIK